MRLTFIFWNSLAFLLLVPFQTHAEATWIEDVPGQDYPVPLYCHVMTMAGRARASGIEHRYRIEIRGHTASASEAKDFFKTHPAYQQKGEVCPYGNELCDSLEVYIDDQKIVAPAGAIQSVLNFDIGKPTINLFPSKHGLIFYIVFHEYPAGEDSVSFVFRDGKFWKRQYRSPHYGPQQAGRPVKNFDTEERFDF